VWMQNQWPIRSGLSWDGLDAHISLYVFCAVQGFFFFNTVKVFHDIFNDKQYLSSYVPTGVQMESGTVGGLCSNSCRNCKYLRKGRLVWVGGVEAFGAK
jgi:hypothetical protein